MSVDIVIGAGFGDEAKGVTTDALASKARTEGRRVCVVRFNGGAQAGHTVQLPDGTRHVFHHFGAGSLAGVPTHLGQRFVVHPMLFAVELELLRGLGGNVAMTIDPRAPLTLPCDVAINQAIEQQRGASRHGSCGVGFGEAVHRNETGHPRHRLTLGQLASLSVAELKDRWQEVATTYVPARLAALGLSMDSVKDWNTPEVFERFVDDCQRLLSHVVLSVPSLLPFDRWVLEGAQGLALDEDLGQFPYVTRSKTGLPWALEFLHQLAAVPSQTRVWYLTRAYATRHGAGSFVGEGVWRPSLFSDPTNQPNLFQGTLRVAPLDVSSLSRLIQQDQARARDLSGAIALDVGVSVSCLDQMGECVELSDGRRVPTHLFPSWLVARLDLDHVMESWGPTRDTFVVPRVASLVAA